MQKKGLRDVKTEGVIFKTKHKPCGTELRISSVKRFLIKQVMPDILE